MKSAAKKGDDLRWTSRAPTLSIGGQQQLLDGQLDGAGRPAPGEEMHHACPMAAGFSSDRIVRDLSTAAPVGKGSAGSLELPCALCHGGGCHGGRSLLTDRDLVKQNSRSVIWGLRRRTDTQRRRARKLRRSGVLRRGGPSIACVFRTGRSAGPGRSWGHFTEIKRRGRCPRSRPNSRNCSHGVNARTWRECLRRSLRSRAALCWPNRSRNRRGHPAARKGGRSRLGAKGSPGGDRRHMFAEIMWRSRLAHSKDRSPVQP